MNTVLWLGPVSTSNISSAVPSSWDVRTYNKGADGGLGSSAFRDWALGLGSDPLTALAPGAERVILAGFSAAHGATEVILEKVVARQDRRLRGLLACDSYYVANGNTTPKPGHLAWLREIIAARDGRKAWFTTSSYDGPGYLSARDSFEMLASRLDMGLADARRIAPTMPEPYLTWKAGPVVWFDYEQKFTHTEHATKLASIALKDWFARGFERPAAKRLDSNDALLLIGILLTAYAMHRSRSR